MKANLELLPWSCKKLHSRNGYTFLDRILFSRPTGFRKLEYTKHIWKAWEEIRPKLKYNFRDTLLPGHWLIQDIIYKTKVAKRYSGNQVKRIIYFLSRLQIVRTSDLWDKDQECWIDFSEGISRIRNLPEWAEEAITRCLRQLQSGRGIDHTKEEILSNWRWPGKPSRIHPLHLTSVKAYKLMDTSAIDIEQLDRWWGVNHTSKVWRLRFKRLWESDISYRGRIFLWRILAQGLFTSERAFKLGRDTGLCSFCRLYTESVKHLFFECSQITKIWLEVLQFFKTPADRIDGLLSSSFLKLLDYSLGKRTDQTARLLVIYEATFAIWKRRNTNAYEGVSNPISPEMIANAASLHARALILYSAKGQRKVRLQFAQQILDTFV
jgi:hypothetical protein